MINENEKYCVFRKGRTWLALSANVVREVMGRPAFVSIPQTHQVLSGLCHIRSEFIPVLNLSSLLPTEPVGKEPFLLIVDDTDGDWAILVDEVDTLATLESSDAPEEIQNLWDQTVVGWATHRGKVVRLIDHARFRQLAEQEMNDSWKRAMDAGHVLPDGTNDSTHSDDTSTNNQQAVAL